MLGKKNLGQKKSKPKTFFGNKNFGSKKIWIQKYGG